MGQAAQLRGLTFGYRGSSERALSDVTCDIPLGVTGLLGVNGAGKSTLMALMARALRPAAGQILWKADDGERQLRREEVSWVPQSSQLPPRFTARELLEYGCFLQGVPRRQRRDRVSSALAAVDLADHRDVRCRALSGGQERRLSLAWGLLTHPRVLLLDEPMAGLDVYQRKGVRGLLNAGLAPCVLISSHALDDIATVADHLLVLDSGSLRYAGSMDAATAIMGEAADAVDMDDRLIALLETPRADSP